MNYHLFFKKYPRTNLSSVGRVGDLNIFCYLFFRGGITPCSKRSDRLCQVKSFPGGLLADGRCVLGCLYLDALDGSSPGDSLSGRGVW